MLPQLEKAPVAWRRSFPFTIKQSMASVEKRVSSLTNASVVRKFLFAVSLSGMPAVCQKHSLVDSFHSAIYLKQ